MPTTDRTLTPLKHPISQRLHEERTRGERLADTISDRIGSWRFLIIQTIAITLWVGINILGLVLRWDPYPFVLLSLLFSVQAAYLGPILLLSQNRSAQRDRIMAEHDYATNERAEQFTEALLSELLRNSQATLAIAGFHGIEIEAIARHESQLAEKIDAVQEQLAEVEDVLIAAAEASGLKLPESGAHHADDLRWGGAVPDEWKRSRGTKAPCRKFTDETCECQIGELVPSGGAAGSSPGRSSPRCRATHPASPQRPSAQIRTRRPITRPTARMNGELSRQGLLDTNILILRRWIDPAELPDEMAISSVTLAELSEGPHEVRRNDEQSLYDEHEERARRMEILQRAESEFDPVPFDTEAARVYGRLAANAA